MDLRIVSGCENYSSWRRSMIVALAATNKIKFVDGRLPQPEEDDEVLHGYSLGHMLYGRFPNRNAAETGKAPAANQTDAQENGDAAVSGNGNNHGNGKNMEQDLVATFAQCQKLMNILS
uniref:Retrotransposon Copia-like N-terminal domain-containing protein n=1 Tax=Cannabis sativa TaxID=3483 RepID=A0A803QCK1_CANSA